MRLNRSPEAVPPCDGEGADVVSTVDHLAPSRPLESPGAVVGRYKLLQSIGEGGFGSVFMAEQSHPVRRTVALKVIKLGMDTKQVVARFEAERQALALMDHPNIAKVLDAGSTDAGRPYFVMELVKGVPITEYCDKNSLSTAERLELFVQVCHAVQHAHQKGVIHRDIKPSNVLVTMADGKPIPKVIDFGIAKATNQRLTEQTLFTEYRQLIGTPEYMSPEQAEMSGIDIDTRSDVYSLGVLLYELLTGTTPFAGSELRFKAYAEIQRIIREVEPPRPSTRLSTLAGEKLGTVAARRRTDAGRLSRAMRGELDWVVMKCLEKDRTRRYDTANGLAADVRRHLSGEPVLARPSSAAYRVSKFARKHRAAAASAAAVAAALVVGTAAASFGLVRARASERAVAQERNNARQEAARATAAGALADQRRVEVEAALEDVKKARAKAEKDAARAHAVSHFMTYMLKAPTDAGSRQNVRVVDLLSAASASIGPTLKDQPEAEFDVRAVLGSTYSAMAMVDQAESNLRQARELGRRLFGDASPDVIAVTSELAYVLGLRESNGAEATKLAQAAYDAAVQTQGPRARLSANTANVLAIVHSATGAFDKAEAIHRQLLEAARTDATDESLDSMALNNLAFSLVQQGKLAEAVALQREAVTIEQNRNPVDPVDVSRANRNLAMWLDQQGKLDEAARILGESLDLQRRRLNNSHPILSESIALQAQFARRRGDYAGALELRREQLGRAQAVSTDDSRYLADRLYDVGEVLLLAGKDEEGRRTIDEAVAMCRRVQGDEAAQGWWQWTVLRRGIGEPQAWAGAALRSQVWCVLDEALGERPPTKTFDLNEFDWDQATFKLECWDGQPADGGTRAGHTPLKLVRQGTFSELRAMPDPAPGAYLMSLKLPNAVSGPLERQAWVLFAKWDVGGYTLPDYRGLHPKVWPTILRNGPISRREVGALAMTELSDFDAGPERKRDYFGLVGTTELTLPPGDYRLLLTSDDGARVTLDDRLLINGWYARIPTTDEALFRSTGGVHRIKVEFFNAGDGFKLWLRAQPVTGPAGAPPVNPTKLPSGAAVGAGVDDADTDLASHDAAVRQRGDTRALTERGRHLAMRRQFAKAEADYSRALELDPKHHLHWVWAAYLRLQLGDHDGYRAACRGMLKQFADSSDRGTCDRVAKACAAVPGAVDAAGLERAARMAERATAPGVVEHSGWYSLSRGMVEHRRGMWGPAADWLTKAFGSDDLPVLGRTAAQLFLAMTHDGAGRPAEAREHLRRGIDLLERDVAGAQAANGILPDNWQDWILVHTIRREAEALIKPARGSAAAGE